MEGHLFSKSLIVRKNNILTNMYASFKRLTLIKVHAVRLIEYFYAGGGHISKDVWGEVTLLPVLPVPPVYTPLGFTLTIHKQSDCKVQYIILLSLKNNNLKECFIIQQKNISNTMNLKVQHQISLIFFNPFQ